MHAYYFLFILMLKKTPQDLRSFLLAVDFNKKVFVLFEYHLSLQF